MTVGVAMSVVAGEPGAMLVGDIDIYCTSMMKNGMPIKTPQGVPALRYDDAYALPAFSVLFAGKCVQSDASGVFQIPCDQFDVGNGRLTSLSIALCDHITPVLQSGATLSGLRLGGTYKLFDLVRADTRWTITPRQLPADNPVVAENTIVICVDASHFMSFKQIEPSAEQTAQSTKAHSNINLPVIQLLFDSSDAVTNKAAASLLGDSFDLVPFHTRTKGVESHNGEVYLRQAVSSR